MSEWSPDIVRLQAFDDDEWHAVEKCYAGRLLAYVARRVNDLQAREDIVQESFLGAVRGIESFDPLFTFEQYLFGICRNRTIDYLRRRKSASLGESEDEDARVALDSLARDVETPSAIVRRRDLRDEGRALLVDVLRDWVQETWEAGEIRRLMVIEALFCGGWRNRDTWARFDLRDETAVAGIKFRALKRLRELASKRAGAAAGGLLDALAEHSEEGHTEIDVGAVWREGRVSCPARHWLARRTAGTLEPDAAEFLDFHLAEMECAWCQANLDDLAGREDLDVLLDRVRASTGPYLRSKTAHG